MDLNIGPVIDASMASFDDKTAIPFVLENIISLEVINFSSSSIDFGKESIKESNTSQKTEGASIKTPPGRR